MMFLFQNDSDEFFLIPTIALIKNDIGVAIGFTWGVWALVICFPRHKNENM
jgi:hypothetical protein